MVASVILLQHGIEPICQTACRDRNRIGLQADALLNILALTGRSRWRSYRRQECIWSVRLTTIHKLNDCDQPLTDGATDLFVGAASILN